MPILDVKYKEFICDNCKQSVIETKLPAQWQIWKYSCGDHYCRGDHEEVRCPSCLEDKKEFLRNNS